VRRDLKEKLLRKLKRSGRSRQDFQQFCRSHESLKKIAKPEAVDASKLLAAFLAKPSLFGIEAGADALGFNLVRKSKRYIDIQADAGWIDKLPKEICKVAVTVNPAPGTGPGRPSAQTIVS